MSSGITSNLRSFWQWGAEVEGDSRRVAMAAFLSNKSCLDFLKTGSRTSYHNHARISHPTQEFHCRVALRTRSFIDKWLLCDEILPQHVVKRTSGGILQFRTPFHLRSSGVQECMVKQGENATG
ncbi:hypothetical protein D5086_005611 [Populus alba]|uniref:Uncharacterized protein n=1 Tax=Populus alba TaxID=43335 RepID=A0ACC4CUJ5_POPAL